MWQSIGCGMATNLFRVNTVTHFHTTLCDKIAGCCEKIAENAINLPKVLLVASRAAAVARVTVVKAVHNQMDGKYCNTNV